MTDGARPAHLRRCISDNRLHAILEKVLVLERLSGDDGLLLYRTPDLTGVGALANHVRERMHGAAAHFVRNQHINYTNICNKGCRFCFFARSPKEGGPAPYTRTPDEVREALLRYGDVPIREVHVVGGINPRLPYSYYIELLSAIRSARPSVQIKAFTVVELVEIQRVARKPLDQVLEDLRTVGLSSVPGGGAEVLSERVHSALCPAKLTPAQWVDVSRAVARSGLRQYSTMLYGHIETDAERVGHLLRLRELQDETGHLLAFTPLSFHPEGTYLSDLPGPTGRDDLRNIAVARMMLDNIPHIKTFWVMSTQHVSQIALWYGADDFDGTVQEYEITFEEGRFGDRRQVLTYDAMLALIREAGRQPVERDGLYGKVRT